MRLNGRTAILAHLGRSARNRRGWKAVRRDYAAALRYLPNSFRVWTTSKELDAVDRARCLSVTEAVSRVDGDAPGMTLGEAERKASVRMLKMLGMPVPDFSKRQG